MHVWHLGDWGLAGGNLLEVDQPGILEDGLQVQGLEPNRPCGLSNLNYRHYGACVESPQEPLGGARMAEHRALLQPGHNLLESEGTHGQPLRKGVDHLCMHSASRDPLDGNTMHKGESDLLHKRVTGLALSGHQHAWHRAPAHIVLTQSVLMDLIRVLRL